jgi:hypothetical protein
MTLYSNVHMSIYLRLIKFLLAISLMRVASCGLMEGLAVDARDDVSAPRLPVSVEHPLMNHTRLTGLVCFDCSTVHRNRQFRIGP